MKMPNHMEILGNLGESQTYPLGHIQQIQG